MEYDPLFDSILAALAVASTIMLLGALYLLILRAPKLQYSLRFLLLSVGCIATVIGLWTALLRTSGRPGLTGPRLDIDTEPPMAPAPMGPDSEPQFMFPSDQLDR